ncbi:MAG: hypothetical protein M1819_005485 [Sarea resinae]|nr:MAG: hypothetical protein M1819_005485 [Sarea resinae]
MSLLARVSSMESFENVRDRTASPPGSERRKLSFNPVGTWVPPPAHEEPIGAFEVSPGRRLFQVITAVCYCLLAAGIVFGYAALKPVLINEGAYRDHCTQDELDENVRVCYEQEMRLNFMFTFAAVATNVCALPVGTVLDRYGPRVSSLIGCLLFATGCLFFAFAADLPFDGYIPGYLFLALGGPFVFISSFQLSNTFPAHSGLILSMLTGAFDTSSAVFLIYRIVYWRSHATIRPKIFFLVYLFVPAFILVAQILYMPSKSYKTVGELVKQVEDSSSNDEHDSDADIDSEDYLNQVRDDRRIHRESVVSEITSLLGSKGADQQTKKEEQKMQVSGVWGALHGRTAWQQIRTPWFVLITLFTLVQMTRINFFVATIRPQYEYLLHSYDKAVRVNSFFDVALPLGGVLSVPFIGFVLDNTSTPFVLALLVATATAIGVLGVLPYEWAAYANIVLFVLYRPFYYTTVSDYAAKVFGFATFGKVYGLVICLAGLFNFSQSGLDALTHRVFLDDPVPVNLILLGVALVVGVALVGYVWWKSRSMKREHLEDEAEGARETLMPGAEY